MSEKSAFVCRPAVCPPAVCRPATWFVLLGLVGAAFNPAIGQERLQDHTRILRELAPIDYLPEHGGPSAGRIDLRIVFDVNKASLRPHAIRQLNELGRALQSDQLKSMRFLIIGHTDANGPAAHNKRLSLARARTVKNWLVSRQGIAARRLDVEGRGEERLKDALVPDSRVNRRVEIVRLAQRGRARAAASGAARSGSGEDLSVDLGAGWARTDLKQQNKAANFVASKARDQGRVRVIVGVKARRPPATGGSQSLQNYIANVQQEAMGSLGWVNFNDLVRLKHTPQLVISVDAGELDQLIQSQHVASVHEDSPNKAFLSRSVGVIGRPVTNYTIEH